MFGPRVSKMTAPFNIEYHFLKNITDEDPSKISDLGVYNVGGHY